MLSDGKYGAPMLYAQWSGDMPVLELTSRFATRDHTVELGRPRADAERLNAAKRVFHRADRIHSH